MMNYFQRLTSFFFNRQCEEEIAVLKSDNDQLEREKSDYKERLKQLTKTKLVDDLMQKKTGVSQRLSGVLSTKLIIISFIHSPPSGATTESGTVSPQRQLPPLQISDLSPASEQEV
jgi:hypothetical protein